MLGFVLDRKEAFLDYKNINPKVEILLFFSKVLVHGFGQKLNRLRKSFW